MVDLSSSEGPTLVSPIRRLHGPRCHRQYRPRAPRAAIHLFTKPHQALRLLAIKAPDSPPFVSTAEIVTFSKVPLNDMHLLAKCLMHDTQPVNAIFAVVGANTNIPHSRLAEETAHAVVAAICNLRVPADNASTSVPFPDDRFVYQPRMCWRTLIELNRSGLKLIRGDFPSPEIR
ncbi:hypothetical protein HO173_003583 [Letharia columbiana]|uniref:Uncharacterized protein n=1 Tax=Letharia columbiana TaxID=112416 RepID=A0A8H6G0L5_9LECA|nr:uncharacterized protein HO173_003583 [Letharia columbiana]KAF6238303.1 hypothetical protein HO173_003583 [Letharia columbiana]